MKTLAALILLASAPLFAQTMRYEEPQPDQVRIAQLADAEFDKLTKESDARQKALEAYFAARDEYNKTKTALEDKYDAHQTAYSCEGQAKTDVEWKGKFIVVEKYSAQPAGINGCGGPSWFTTSPSVGTLMLTR
jgi:Skp family chaperone for outer membrane proteins